MKTIKPHVFSFVKMLVSLLPVFVVVLGGFWWLAVLIFICAFFYHKSFRVLVFKENITFKSGLLFGIKKVVLKNRVSFISADSPLLLKPFGVFRVSLYCDFTKVFRLYLNKRDTAFLLKEFSPHSKIKRHSPRFVSLLVVSLIFSNSFAGVGIIFAFLWQLKKVFSLFGREIDLPFSLSFSLSAVAFLVLFSWTVSALSTLLKNLNFSVLKKGGCLLIKSGVITVRRVLIRLSEVSFLCVKENLFGKIFGFSKLFIKGQNQKDCPVVPAIKGRDIPLFLSEFFENFKFLSPTISPDPAGFLGFILPSAVIYFILTVLTVMGVKLFPDFSKAVATVGVVLLFVTMWFCVLKIIDFFTTGISRNGDFFTLCYSKGFSLYKVATRGDSILFIQFRQSVIQRFFKNCDVIVYTKGYAKHRVKNVNLKNAVKILKEDY